MRLFMDLDGFISFGCTPSALPISGREVPISTDAQSAIVVPTRSLQLLCAPGSWEYHVARLVQRVQETRELLQQDLQEIEEPLTMFTTPGRTLSLEQQAQLSATQQDYQQVTQVIDQALALILQHFPTEIATLDWLQREHHLQTESAAKASIACSQEEKTLELATP